jgi:hypothetical protein
MLLSNDHANEIVGEDAITPKSFALKVLLRHRSGFAARCEAELGPAVDSSFSVWAAL